MSEFIDIHEDEEKGEPRPLEAFSMGDIIKELALRCDGLILIGMNFESDQFAASRVFSGSNAALVVLLGYMQEMQRAILVHREESLAQPPDEEEE